MTTTIKNLVGFACSFSATLPLVFGGCGKSASNGEAAASNPKEAASQLEQAFASASLDVKNDAKIASEALRAADYEKAVQSLEVIKARENLTLEQGLAVYNSMMALDAKLIAAMEAGDPNAKRAFELLKKRKRE